MEIRERPLPEGWEEAFSHTPPLVGRLYAARGTLTEADAHLRLKDLHAPLLLGDIDKAVERIQKAIDENQSIIISGDYDCDGATATTTAIRGLRLLGATRIGFTIPDRFKHGYGLTPALIDDLPVKPDLLITVDSGVASHAGIAHAAKLGIDVVVTDHHLPSDTLPPEAVAIVNPNLKDDGFPSKALAGVGVMFYVLLRLRAVQVQQGRYEGKDIPDLAELLDIVAMGTVADLVPLDANNRRLVKSGLKRIQDGKGHAGIKALIAIAGVDEENIQAADFAFFLAPRLNAAGRLENMKLGVELLLTDDDTTAAAYAQALDGINQDRRELQSTMLEEAEAIVAEVPSASGCVHVVYKVSWHAGVVGLVASKLKESYHRPTVAFAPGEEGSGLLHGSGRSIPGFHLRDALALVDTRCPGLILKFGGHAMAAGLTIREEDLKRFHEALESVVMTTMDPKLLQPVLWTDGPLTSSELTTETARMLTHAGPWGQAFPEPVFDNVFRVLARNLVGQTHVRFLLEELHGEKRFEAMAFNAWKEDELTPWIRAIYVLEENLWQGRSKLQLRLQHFYYLREEPLP